MECEIYVGEIANRAVCSKRATLLGNVDRANRKAAVRAELTKRLDVKPVGIRGGGRSSQYHSRILDRWAANTAALKAPRRKTPCRSRALLVDCSTCCQPMVGIPGVHEGNLSIKQDKKCGEPAAGPRACSATRRRFE